MTEGEDDAPDDEYPPLTEAAYELRFTRRALADLGCTSDVSPGDINAVLAAAKHTAIVEEFRDQRTIAPIGTRGSMRNVVRHDIHALRGPVGERACTWFEEAAGVCWFLGWVAQHDFTELEERAANGELLPDVEDLTTLTRERQNVDFATVIGLGIRTMVNLALDAPDRPVRRTIGSLLQLDVAVEAVPIEDTTLADIYITVKVPPLHDPPQGWPGSELPIRLAELATDEEADALHLEYPERVPTEDGASRQIDFAQELAVVVRGWALPT